MDAIKVAIYNLQDSIPVESKKDKDVEYALMQLHSTANLLKLSTVPPNTFKRLSELLRQRLLPIYQVSLTQALQYSAMVLEFIQADKLIPALNTKDEPLKQLWEQLLTSLISGVLDYLDQSPDIQSRESIASVFYPVLIRIYFSPLAMFLSEVNAGLLSAAYQLLVTTVEPQARNAARLRDHGINSKNLGLTLSQIRDFLAIESLLDIICTLIPPIKNGLEKRSQFIKEVFDPDLFQCSKSILQILESITDGDWSITAVKIIEALASSDISFPQPFDASSLMICGISVNVTAPFYVDKNGFLANLDQDGKLETLHVPFHTVTRVVGSSINNTEISIALILTMPPIIGTEPLSLPSGRGLSVSWRLKKLQLDKFVNVAKNRNLIFLNSTRKLSLPGTHIAFNLPADKQPQALVSTQEKIHDMAKLLAMASSPGPPDHAELSYPINQQSPHCSSSREQKREDINPSTKQVAAIVEDDADSMLSVFLDRSGNLSFTDPSYPVNKTPLGDNTILANSSIPELPPPLAQQSMKNQDEDAAVTSRVTRSHNIAPQVVQKPPIGKPNKKSAPTKNPPAVKNVILGHSTAPIDVDRFPDLKETIPLLKTQKRRSVAARAMNRAATKPLDEPLEDRSVEINISPVNPKPESKKRSTRNMEDSEAIHVADQGRAAKRTRIESGQPSHPTLPYQRKKYGRNGRTSSPRTESPGIPIVDFDEIPDPKPTGVVEGPKSRVSTMKGKRLGKKTEAKLPAPKKRGQERQDVSMDVKPAVPRVPVSLVKTKKNIQIREPLAEIDHHPVEQGKTVGSDMEPDNHSTSLGRAPSIPQAVTPPSRNENNARLKQTQTAPWEEDKNLQNIQIAFDPIHSLSTKEMFSHKDETWDNDHSLTLLVDDDDHKREKEAVEPSTSVPDIVMIDLTTQENPIPAMISSKIFPRSSLKQDKPVANVQPALPGKQTQKVEVEISLPHPLPTKDRHNHRPSVSFALPVESKRYPWTETSTPTRKQRDLDSTRKSHNIRKSWEKSDNNKTTSHQQRYPKKRGYEQSEEPIERIAEIIKQISETIVHRISRRFDSVRDELHAGHRSILQGTLEHLERMHEESTTHLANMVSLEEEYALRCGNILKGFDDVRESAKNVSCWMKNIVKDHNQQSLSKRFPPKLFEKRTGILLNATIGSKR